MENDGKWWRRHTIAQHTLTERANRIQRPLRLAIAKWPTLMLTPAGTRCFIPRWLPGPSIADRFAPRCVALLLPDIAGAAPAVRPQIGLAYLLARTTDTIADSELLPLGQRLAARPIAGAHPGNRFRPLNFGELARQQSAFRRADPAGTYRPEPRPAAAIAPADQTRARGPRHHHQRTGTGFTPVRRRFRRRIVALESEEQLEDYTYRVAGCVGEFWTSICRAHLFPRARLDEARLLVEGVRFGKGLQLVNILRDLPRDLRNGRCYLPKTRLETAGLTPASLLNPADESRIRPLYNEYLDRAENHLSAGWHYTNTLPAGCVRVRLACAWPC